MALARAGTRPLVTVSNWDMLSGFGMCANAIYSGSWLPATWPAANEARYSPIYLSEPATLVNFWVPNGTVAGNVDIGLYREDYSRIVSSGSVAQAGANALQVFDVADTPLTPGRYYIGLVISTVTTAQVVRMAPTINLTRTFGVLMQSSALPLPDPMVPVAVSGSGYFPHCGFSMRVTI